MGKNGKPSLTDVDKRLAIAEERFEGHLVLPAHPGAVVDIADLKLKVNDLRYDFGIFRATVVAYATAGAVAGSLISNLIWNFVSAHAR